MIGIIDTDVILAEFEVSLFLAVLTAYIMYMNSTVNIHNGCSGRYTRFR